MQYYRQEKPITLIEEKRFIKNSKKNNYKAFILTDGKKRYGMFALHGSELCVVSPEKYIAIGVNALKALNPNTMIFGYVFTYNPALKIYLSDCGFEVFGVKEKYCKKKGDWVSAVHISNL